MNNLVFNIDEPGLTLKVAARKNSIKLLTQSARKIRTASDMVEVLTLHLLLIRLAMVEVVEVADDDRYRQGNREHTGNRAQRPDDLAPHADRPVCCVVEVRSLSMKRKTKRNETC